MGVLKLGNGFFHITPTKSYFLIPTLLPPNFSFQPFTFLFKLKVLQLWPPLILSPLPSNPLIPLTHSLIRHVLSTSHVDLTYITLVTPFTKSLSMHSSLPSLFTPKLDLYFFHFLQGTYALSSFKLPLKLVHDFTKVSRLQTHTMGP